MRIVVDTNTVISALLWGGPPGQILNAAREKRIALYSSTELVAELAEVIARQQFARPLRATSVSAVELVADYARLARIVIPAAIGPTAIADLDDDQLLACALAADADMIVSGDKRLRNLKSYQHIPIVGAADAVTRIQQGS